MTFLVHCMDYPEKLMTCLMMEYLNKNRALLCHNPYGCAGNIRSLSWTFEFSERQQDAADSSVPSSRVPGIRENKAFLQNRCSQESL